MTDAAEDAAKAKARELEVAIAERVRKVQEEQSHLELLQKQVRGMEEVQVHGIQQLRAEIVRVTGELEHWQHKLRASDERLTLATSTLEKCQDTKRVLSERLLSVLLESEEAKQERLQSVEQSLVSIEGDARTSMSPNSARAAEIIREQ